MPQTDDFSIGVEEEFQIVHPETRDLSSRAGRVLPEAKKNLGDKATNELYQSQIETGTPVCRTLQEVRTELIRLRREIIAAAEATGSAIAAAGTHPFSRWQEQSLTPKDRYRGLFDEYQQLTREQVIFGCHVHVGIRDREAAIRVMNRCRPWLATILALSANSPFWQGVDTGYASYRTEVFGRFPTAEVPMLFADRAEFDRVVADLVAIGMIQDASKIYWDIRPSAKVETLEFRVADVATTIDEAVLIAGLCRALAQQAARDDLEGKHFNQARPELVRAAKWHAARHGLEHDLIDLEQKTPVSARKAVDSLLQFLAPTLDGLGDRDEIESLTESILRTGNGATRQRAAFARSGNLEAVVDQIREETSKGV